MNTIHTINYNNKLNNDVFIHIDEAPAKALSYSNFPRPVTFIEQTQSKQTSLDMLNQQTQPTVAPIEVQAELFDLIRFPADKIPNIFTLMSHATDPQTFFKKYVKPGVTEIAVYMFKRKR